MTKREYFSSNDNRISIEYRNEHRESIEECDAILKVYFREE